MKLAAAFFLLCGLVLAQNPAAGIRGVVKDAASGMGIPNIEVMLAAKGTKGQKTTTDSQGGYSFRDLAPGEAAVGVMVGRFPSSRRLNLAAGETLVYDLRVQVAGSISGKVVDEDGEPVPGVSVFLVGREWHAGAIRTLIKGWEHTDDQGEYSIPNVAVGRAFYVYANTWQMKLPVISPVPVDAKMRRRVVAPTFYPSSRDVNGAAALTLISGEHREAVNIKMPKAEAYCLEATLENAGVPGPLAFTISNEEARFGTGANGGMYGVQPGAAAGNDGRIRVCDLPPGFYRLDASDYKTTPPSMGTAMVTIGDRDVRGVKVEALGAQPLSGEVVWDGKPPAQAVESKLQVSLEPVVRSHRQGEQMSENVSLPSPFRLASVPEGEYSFSRVVPPAGLYIRDVTYNGSSILNGTLRVGSAMGNAGLRVLVADGAGSIAMNAKGSDDKPAAGVNGVAMPANAASDGAVAAGLKKCSTDQDGNCVFAGLAPGKYFVLATEREIDMTPELVSQLWQARATHAAEVELAAGAKGKADVKVAVLR